MRAHRCSQTAIMISSRTLRTTAMFRLRLDNEWFNVIHCRLRVYTYEIRDAIGSHAFAYWVIECVFFCTSSTLYIFTLKQIMLSNGNRKRTTQSAIRHMAAAYSLVRLSKQIHAISHIYMLIARIYTHTQKHTLSSTLSYIHTQFLWSWALRIGWRVIYNFTTIAIIE